MNKIDEKFDTEVPDALVGAVSIAWEGCHKIYILMDEEQHEQMISWGYNESGSHLLRLDKIGFNSALEILRDWFEQSCGLRFINAVSTVKGDPNLGFQDVIAQFETDDEDELEDEDEEVLA